MQTRRAVAIVLTLTIGLMVLGWIDYRWTQRDLLRLMVDQAVTLRHAVAAAARSVDAASAQAQNSLAARLLDNARLIDGLLTARALDQTRLDAIAARHHLFRVTVFDAQGQRLLSAGTGGPPPGAGPAWSGGRGVGQGRGAGQGFGPGAAGRFGGNLLDRLLAGDAPEAVSEVHGSRWGRGWRLSAGIRRERGGAIVLNVDAADLRDLGQTASLDHLLSDIAAGSRDIAYVVLADAETSSTHGPLAEAAAAAGPVAGDEGVAPAWSGQEGLAAYTRTIGAERVLEFAGPVDPGTERSPQLRMGLRLDGLRQAERRSLVRLVLLLAGALGLGVMAVAFSGLKRQHGALQERHALAEAALRRRDRLAAMGELASTVAHEVRNPLNAIGMTVQRLRREFVDAAAPPTPDDRTEQRELLDVMTGETQRINRIVQQFLEYARPPRLAVQRVEVAGLLREVARAEGARAESRGVTIDAASSGAGIAVLDPDQMRQALGNLLRNAVDAAPDGSRVTVRADRTDSGSVIIIEDHGAGIPPDVLPRVFDLYFTTKPDGSGIGLAVAHRVVEAHGGSIEVDSAPSRGTRMIVRIPALEEPADHA